MTMKFVGVLSLLLFTPKLSQGETTQEETENQTRERMSGGFNRMMEKYEEVKNLTTATDASLNELRTEHDTFKEEISNTVNVLTKKFEDFKMETTATVETLTATPVCECSEGFVKLGDSCYWFAQEKKSYTDARTKCWEAGARLVTVENSQENELLKQYATNHAPATKAFYIGANDIFKEGTFTWDNGTPFNYTDWIKHNPNNYNNQDCVTMHRAEKYQWNDDYCREELNFLCEIPCKQ